MIKKIIRTLLLIFCTVMVTSCAQPQKGTEEVLLEFEEQYIKEHNYDQTVLLQLIRIQRFESLYCEMAKN